MNIKESLSEIFKDEETLNYTPKKMKFWHMVRNFLICCAICDLLMIAYIGFGHDKGWKRADVWYTCLHTHHQLAIATQIPCRGELNGFKRQPFNKKLQGYFLRNVKFMVLVEVYGANYAKANWANWAKGKLGKLLFSMCTGNVTNYKYNIYNNKYNNYNIYIIIIIFIINLEKQMCIYENAQFAFAQFAQFAH